MIRPGCWLGLIALLALTISTGCASITLTAANSVNPVLLGPVKAVGGRPVPPHQEYDGLVNYFLTPIDKGHKMTPWKDSERYDKMAKAFKVDIIYSRQATAQLRTMYSSDYSNYGYIADTASSANADDPQKTDAGVVDATDGNVNRQVDLAWIDCDGHFVYLVFLIKQEVACKARGLSFRSP
jgi:hypothetical protein